MARFAALVGLVCLAGLALAFPGTAIVRPSLLEGFKTNSKQSIAVILKAGVSPAYKQIEGKTYAVRGQKMTELRSALIAHIESSQKSLRQLLDSKSVSYKTFWITNRVIIPEASLELVHALAAHPDVAEVREKIVVPLEPFEVKSVETEQQDDRYVRGVFVVGAPSVWASGNHGEGTIVSSIDTGVLGTHSVLQANFRGDFGWFDPSGRSSAPSDDQGHGTHTMGTIAGQNGYGVAPGAKWMSCLGCTPFGCSEDDLLDCAAFTSCPHDTNGQNEDCSKAPHVTSNSWGSTVGGQTWYDDAIAAFKAAGVIPVFSAGNSGSSCSTVGSPGDRDVIGVAATDFEDAIAYFSSRGPASGTGQHKPDISAPGVDVLSSWYTSEDAFTTLSGTSMACPHVSGGVALLLAGRPELIGDFEGVKAALNSNAWKSGLTGSGQNCGGINDSTFPNHVFGNGRLDLVASISGGNATRY